MGDLTKQMGDFIATAMKVFDGVLLLVLMLLILWVIVTYIIDVTQTQQTIRRNYPIIGRFRYFFEHVGKFFRQYFFAMDREELPFNRAQRSWVYRAAKNVDTTVAFGSTDNQSDTGRVLFVNCAFPTLGQDAVLPGAVTLGEGCEKPYTTKSFFNISGMSYGAISRPAVLALSAGAKEAGCWMNTGEGGLSPYHLEGGADIVFQIGTAKNGVRDLEGNLSDEKLSDIASHDQVKMFEIKMSQGAKPGKGGILPGEKVSEEIASIRGINVGEDALSPNRHVDINSFDDLLTMIHRVRTVTGKPTGFKMVVGKPSHVDDLLKAVKQRGADFAPDFITIDGAEGGTGAAPMALIDSVGMSLRESLPLLVDKLNQYGFRKRVKVVASGKLITPAAVAWSLCAGADFIVSARGFMFSLGCIQALQCNKNTCPTGITTHDPKLQHGLHPATKAVRVTSYVNNMIKEVGTIAHSCGVKNPRALDRTHARIVMSNGLTKSMDEIFPVQQKMTD
jgi:glutamate synthase domain-containing protein 2